MPNPDGSLTAAESDALRKQVTEALAALETVKADMIRRLPSRGSLPLPLSLEERLQVLEKHLGYRESADDVVSIPSPETVAAEQAAENPGLISGPRAVAMPTLRTPAPAAPAAPAAS
jgi:hypothetical protein